MMSLVAGGPNGEVWVIPVETSGQIGTAERSNDLESKLSEYDGARLLSAAHASVTGASQVLYAGTSHGLIAWNTSDLQGGAEPYWIFDNVTAEQFVRPADPFNTSKSAVVNVLKIDGPRDVDGQITNQQILWVGTAGGLHAYDLVAGPTDPFNAFNRERMENNDGGWVMISVQF